MTPLMTRLSLTGLEVREVTDANDTLREAIDLGAVMRVATASGSIASATDVNMYKVFLRAGQASFDIDTPTNGAPGLGSYIRFFNDRGTQLAANNDAQAPDEPPIPANRDGDKQYFDSYLGVRITQDGWYYLGVSNWQNTGYNPTTGSGDRTGTKHLTGSYQLQVRSEQANNVIQVTGTRSTSSGSRGAIRNGVFSPTGTDTLSQDRRQAEGTLTYAEQQRHSTLLRSFLRGETNGNVLTGRPTESEKQSIIDPIVSRFLAGTGGTLAHQPGSVLSNLVQTSGNFQYLKTKFQTHVQQTLQSQAERGVIDFSALNISTFFSNSKHNINYAPTDLLAPFTLRAVLGGTQALRITVQMQAVNPAVQPIGGGQIGYHANVRFEIFDVFGAGNNDRYIAALESMWQLQHRGTQARPFFNHVVIEQTINGVVNVPQRYNSIVVR